MAAHRNSLRWIVSACFLGVLTILPVSAQAQRGGGFGRPQTPLMYLRDEDVQQELGITEEQRSELMDIVSRTFSQSGNMFENFRRMRSAETDEERNRIREEIRSQMQERIKEIEVDAQRVISGGQFSRLKQIALQAQGSRAIAQEELQQELGLSEDQRSKVSELNDQRSEALRALGRDADPEESQRIRDDFDGKIQEVLTDDQKSQWKQKMGEPSEAAQKMVQNRGGGDRNRTRRGGRDEDNDSERRGPPGSRQDVENKPESRSASRGEDNAQQDDSADDLPTGDETPVVVNTPETQVPDGAEVTASFGSDAGTTGQATEETGKISFNFRYAPWPDVLRLFAEVGGLTLDLNEVPQGTFSYYDPNSYTPTEAIDVINGYLLPKGFILVRRDNFLVSVDVSEGIAPNLVPDVSLEELDNRGKNELLSVVIPLSGIDAEKAAEEAQALLGPQGTVASLSASNAIAVTDIGANLRRIRDLLEKATLREGPTDMAFRSFKVRNIPVSEAERTIRNLFGIGSGVPNVSAAASGERDRDRRRSSWDRRREDDGRRDQSGQAQASDPTIQIASDSRTNTLLVSATIAKLTMIEQVLQTVDVGGEGSDFVDEVKDNKPFLRVYELEEADAFEVSKTLNALMPGVVVNEDARNDLLHIFASPADQKEAEQLIRQLDGLGGGQSVAVMPLSTADPASTALVLRSLFAGDEDRAPKIEADNFGRRIMVRGTPDQITQVRSLLTQLGENGQAGQQSLVSGKGPIRMIPLGGRDPSDLLPLIERLWNASGRANIRVVVPSDEGESRRPSSRLEATDIGSDRGPTIRSATLLQSTANETDEPDASDGDADFEDWAREIFGESPDDGAAPKSQSGGESTRPMTSSPNSTGNDEADRRSQASAPPEVTVTVRGGQLMLLSEDEDILDQLEQLVQSLMLTSKPQTQWTVFYLRTADATTSASMLQQLFPDATIGGGLLLGSSSSADGLSPLGSDPTVEIIPETRLNALFVRGPKQTVDRMEEVLKLLDSAELPESLRDRVPRTIPVAYADVSEVAAILKDVYADQMGDNDRGRDANRGRGQRGGNGSNPFEAMLGGMQAASRPTEVRVSIGVDTQTSQIVVSANEATFNEISRLVETLDDSARAANRTVRVMSVNKENSLLIQQALGSVIPKVRVSTTGTPQSGRSASPSSSSSARSGDDAAAAQARDAIRQQMLERFRQTQGGGGRPAGAEAQNRGGNQRGSGGGDRGNRGQRGRR
ncbi:secretin N-terminal domain-containing protein [Stratiformator vulcanicus]|uniref:Bacterial type II/III secretion system short domain protein n=1 Tax=Stratiformator vulcanicus TaxID=2527980 RepID=A0A517R257_9PLAN|nr:secretin N-terminal domain-containing protein [Stratiformator vulcanicus]QDT37941.1 Bacterial type II/III secretion system short domain protein [Stratiformator vulcanicus]